MHDFQKLQDPDHNSFFRHRWSPSCPPSRRERRLALLRAKFGNIEGRRKYIIECYGPEVAEWL